LLRFKRIRKWRKKSGKETNKREKKRVGETEHTLHRIRREDGEEVRNKETKTT
jgi:hypothetical protein